MPPAALRSATAWSTPFFICAPVAALEPVIGPAIASLTSAEAVPAIVSAKPSASPSVVMVFIDFPSEVWSLQGRDLTSAGLAAPAQEPRGLIDPTILCDHLPRAGGSKA